MSESNETKKERCASRNAFGSRCQLEAGHATNSVDGGHAFPIDDAFLDALDAGDIIIGRPPKKSLFGRLRRWFRATLSP